MIKGPEEMQQEVQRGGLLLQAKYIVAAGVSSVVKVEEKMAGMSSMVGIDDKSSDV